MSMRARSGRPEAAHEITVDEAKAALDRGSALFVDVRRADQYTAGHIPGAVAVPLLGEAGSLFSLPGDRDIIVY